MAIFRCSKCGRDEDTALSNYWSARLREMPTVCSLCDPKIGKWHREFHEEGTKRHTRRARAALFETWLADGSRLGIEVGEEGRHVLDPGREQKAIACIPSPEDPGQPRNARRPGFTLCREFPYARIPDE